MANIIKTFLNSLKEPEDDYDDYVDELEEKDRKKQEKQEMRQSFRSEKRTFASKNQDEDEDDSLSDGVTSYSSATNLSEARKDRLSRADKTQTGNQSKVVPLRSSVRGMEVCIMKPTSFEDSQDICDMLLSGRAAVINLEGFDVDIAQRVMDFISGAVYALNGKLHQISSYIFIISPDSVDISGDYLDLIKQNGFEVPTLNKEF